MFAHTSAPLKRSSNLTDESRSCRLPLKSEIDLGVAHRVQVYIHFSHAHNVHTFIQINE